MISRNKLNVYEMEGIINNPRELTDTKIIYGSAANY